MTRLDEYLRESAVAGKLAAGRLSEAEAQTKGKSFARCAQTLTGMGVDRESPAVAHFVPGRIEVLGKHTDYAGGRSLLCAVERGFMFLAAPRPDNHIRVRSIDGASVADFDLEPELQPEMGTWAGYPQTVARRVARNFPAARTGMDLAFYSDLPRASGMSSSSAMVVAMFLALSDVNRLPEAPEYRQYIVTPEDLAGYLGTTENGQTFKSLVGDRGVGTFGGSEDHTAILLSRPGMLVQYSYCPVVHERTIPFPEEHVFAIASSGVVAEKTGSARDKYNRASLLARAVLAEWNRATNRNDPTLAAAVAGAGPGAHASIRQVLARTANADFTSRELLDRFDQFYAESEEILPAFSDALERKELAALGPLVDRSQSLTDTHLKNQVPETLYLARTARDLGAVAASAFGAGFGGSVWAMVPVATSAAFLSEWMRLYSQRFPDCAARATFFTTRPGPAVFRVA